MNTIHAIDFLQFVNETQFTDYVIGSADTLIDEINYGTYVDFEGNAIKELVELTFYSNKVLYIYPDCLSDSYDQRKCLGLIGNYIYLQDKYDQPIWVVGIE